MDIFDIIQKGKELCKDIEKAEEKAKNLIHKALLSIAGNQVFKARIEVTLQVKKRKKKMDKTKTEETNDKENSSFYLC